MNGRSRNELLGVLVMAGSSVIFSVMCGLSKWAYNLGVDAYKITLFRFAIGLAVLGTAAMFNKVRLEFFRSWLLFLRGLSGGVAVFIFYVSITSPQLGLVKGTLINYTYPIFATIGGAVLLHERVGLGKWLAVLAAFAGIYLIATCGGGGLGGFGSYDLLAVLGAISAGFAIVLVRKLRETESSYSIYLAQCAIGFWLMLIPSNFVACRIGLSGGLLLLAIGLTAAAAQLLMTYAYRSVTVSTGSVLGMLTPVINLPIGLLVFGEAIGFRGLIGAAIVLAACVYVSIGRNRRAHGGGGESS